MGLKTQTDAAQKTTQLYLSWGRWGRALPSGLMAGVNSDCVSPSAPTRQGHDCVLPEATAPSRLASPPQNRSPKVATLPLGRADGREPGTQAALGFHADTSAHDSSCGQGHLACHRGVISGLKQERRASLAPLTDPLTS